MRQIPNSMLRGILMDADGNPARLGVSRRRGNQALAVAVLALALVLVLGALT
jgi:hypothetical protein